MLGIPSSDHPSATAASSSSQFGTFSRDLRRPHSSPPPPRMDDDDQLDDDDDDAADDSLDVASSLAADDFAALTAMLDAVSDCSGDDISGDDECRSDDDEESPRGRMVPVQNRLCDDSLEVGGGGSSGGSSVCSRDSFSPMADWQEMQRAESGLLDLDHDDDDAAVAAGAEGRPAGVSMRELPMGGMPCAPLPESDEDAYDDLDVSDEVRALFAHIDAFQPQQVALTPVLKPFVIDMLPALRDPDPMISVPRRK